MEINLNTLEDTINDISFIENDNHNFDLEESIALCITELNNELRLKKENKNNSKKNQKITKKFNTRTYSHNYNSNKNNKIINKNNILVSKEEIEKLKEQIINIFNENSENIKKIHQEQIENDNKLEENLIKARKIYEEEIDKLYNEKIEKINELDLKYNSDIFELKDFVNQEMEGREKEKSNLKQILDSVCDDKQKELNEFEEYFHKEEKKIKKKYKYINNINEEFTEDDRSLIFKNQFYESFKSKIKRVINEKKN